MVLTGNVMLTESMRERMLDEYFTSESPHLILDREWSVKIINSVELSDGLRLTCLDQEDGTVVILQLPFASGSPARAALISSGEKRR